ncbi:MAG: GIY-YIG nuclease family protein [Candidatus Saccharimonadaceae bacterium]|nr:GIY-YIG nuclease family protein [Candidatus Saccharimonadaceae bacterium]
MGRKVWALRAQTFLPPDRIERVIPIRQLVGEESIFELKHIFEKKNFMKPHNYFVYIITNYNKSVLYTGVTNSLSRRINEHSMGLVEGFSKRYNCKYLIYYQHFPDINLAISREKQIKTWIRKKKEELISAFNPGWKFLNDSIPSIEKVYND